MIQWDPRALEVLARLRASGYQAVLVGGCVRDFLRGKEPHDYDAATSAQPEEIIAACANLHYIPTGLRHGTVTVLCQGLPVEVTTFRREGTYSDGRHPDQVSFTTSLTEDLARRDFTVNAMAWDEDGLADRFGGRADLEAGLIRCVGEPERRFQEDALRILRGLRLAAQLDFAIHPDTAQAIRTETPRLAMVARERIGGEFLRLLCGPGAGRVLLDFPQTVCEIVPQLAPTVGFDQKNPHHAYDVFGHMAQVTGRLPNDPVLRFAGILHDIGKPHCMTLGQDGKGHFHGHAQISAELAGAVLRRLKASNAFREDVVWLIKHHMDLWTAEPKLVRRALSRHGIRRIRMFCALQRADMGGKGVGKDPRHQEIADFLSMAEELAAKEGELTLKCLAVKGGDLMALGYPRTPELGKALNRLLELVIAGEVPNEKETLLQQAEQWLENK